MINKTNQSHLMRINQKIKQINKHLIDYIKHKQLLPKVNTYNKSTLNNKLITIK